MKHGMKDEGARPSRRVTSGPEAGEEFYPYSKDTMKRDEKSVTPVKGTSNYHGNVIGPLSKTFYGKEYM